MAHAKINFSVRKNEGWTDYIPPIFFKAVLAPPTLEGRTLLMTVKASPNSDAVLEMTVANGWLEIIDAVRCEMRIVVPVGQVQIIPTGTYQTDMLVTDDPDFPITVFTGSVEFVAGISEPD